MISVFDQVLSPSDWSRIRDLVVSDQFPWYLAAQTIQHNTNTLADPQEQIVPFMFHTVVKQGQLNSQIWPVIEPVAQAIVDCMSAQRLHLRSARINLLLKNQCSADQHTGIHRDAAQHCSHTAIYYVTDSDGDTEFFDDQAQSIQRVTPQQNRLVVFDSDHWHTARAPQQQSHRIVINLNLELIN